MYGRARIMEIPVACTTWISTMGSCTATVGAAASTPCVSRVYGRGQAALMLRGGCLNLKQKR